MPTAPPPGVTLGPTGPPPGYPSSAAAAIDASAPAVSYASGEYAIGVDPDSYDDSDHDSGGSSVNTTAFERSSESESYDLGASGITLDGQSGSSGSCPDPVPGTWCASDRQDARSTPGGGDRNVLVLR